MKQIINSNYSPFFYAGFALTVICAWCSMGMYHADEHYQVLEFCNYKLGYTSPNSYSLPWEFYDKIRASLLPDIGYVIGKILGWCGLYNPFTLAFLLRLFAGLSAWYITCRLCILLAPKFKSTKGANLLVLMSLFLWFVPFLGVRYTAENLSGVFLLYGVYSILSVNEKTSNSLMRYLFAGLFFGMSFFIRVQISFALVGFAAWLIWINKTNWKYLFAIAFSGMVAIGINVIFDYWFYGIWTFSPFNYYYEDIIHHIGKDVNTSPFWFYFPEFISNVFLPISLVLLIMFFTGIYKNLKDPFVWMIIPFFVAHCIIGHKEFRFLFPLAFTFIYICARGFDYLLYQPTPIKGKKIQVKDDKIKTGYQKIHKFVFILLLIIDIPLLAYRTVAPLEATMYSNKYLYNNISEKNTPVFYFPNLNVDLMYCLNTNFYKNPNTQSVLVDSLPQIGDYLRNSKPQSAYLFSTLSFGTTSQANNADLIWNGYKIKMAYCFYPPWLINDNLGNWRAKTTIFRIYQFTPADSLHGFDIKAFMKDPNSFHSSFGISMMLNSAHYLLENNRLDEAEKILTAVVDTTKGFPFPHLHNYIGILDYKKNKIADAEKEFNAEIALNLQSKEAWLNLGVLYFRNKEYDNAVKSMNNVINLDPNNVAALNNLGVYYLYIKKDPAQAIQYFAQTLNLNLYYQQGYINFMIAAQNFSDKQVYTKYQRILADDRYDPYTWVMVNKGMSANDVQSLGINISDKVLTEINSLQ
jgi:GPI mannosyltransferase 3